MNDINRRLTTSADEAVTLFLKDFVTTANIGIYASEKTGPQRMTIDITVRVENCAPPYAPDNVLDYNLLRDGVRNIIDAGHIDYQETLCARIVAMCLALPRVSRTRVRVAKLDAFADCAAVGCEIERANSGAVAYAHEASTRDEADADTIWCAVP
jgi:7,8-dihydroneopterin aldolase/epimerase/oxygenase